jgi:hypothetical protein
MMVGIDDRQIGIEDLLGQSAEPFRFGQRAGISAGFDGHGILPKNRLTISWITGGAVSQNLPRNQSGSEDHAIYPRMMEIEARR